MLATHSTGRAVIGRFTAAAARAKIAEARALARARRSRCGSASSRRSRRPRLPSTSRAPLNTASRVRANPPVRRVSSAFARRAGALLAEHADADRGVDLDVLGRALDRVAQDLERIGQRVDHLEDARARGSSSSVSRPLSSAVEHPRLAREQHRRDRLRRPRHRRAARRPGTARSPCTTSSPSLSSACAAAIRTRMSSSRISTPSASAAPAAARPERAERGRRVRAHDGAAVVQVARPDRRPTASLGLANASAPSTRVSKPSILIALGPGALGAVEHLERLAHRLARALPAAGARALERLAALADALGAEHAEAERGVDLDVDRRALERIAQDVDRVVEHVDQLGDPAAVGRLCRSRARGRAR